jgi:RNAse (barnase) inhibitor barstar
MNNPIILFLVSINIPLVIIVKDLDNKVTMMQQNQEQIIQLIEANQ